MNTPGHPDLVLNFIEQVTFEIKSRMEAIIYEMFIDIIITLHTKELIQRPLSATHIFYLIQSCLQLVEYFMPPLRQKVKLTLKEILGNFNLLTFLRKHG